MPIKNVTPTNALNILANQLKAEQAEQQLRLANYYVPYGFDPEQQDFDRAGELLEQHGAAIADHVFLQASPNLKERVASAISAYQERQGTIEALLTAGAVIEATKEQLFTHARNRVFGNSRAGQQAAYAKVS